MLAVGSLQKLQGFQVVFEKVEEELGDLIYLDLYPLGNTSG